MVGIDWTAITLPQCRNVPAGSPLQGHLSGGDAVTSVNACPVTCCADWITCIMHSPAGTHLPQFTNSVPVSWTPHQMLHRSVQDAPRSGRPGIASDLWKRLQEAQLGTRFILRPLKISAS